MPWSSADAKRMNSGIKTDAQAMKWCKRANGFLSACQAGKTPPLKSAKGDSHKMRCEASAIIIANSALKQKEAFDQGQRLITFGVESLKEAIKETDKASRTVLIQIIQGDNSPKISQGASNFHNGWSKNLYYYSQEILEKLIPHIQRARKMYMDHNRDMWSYGRSMRDWTGTIIETPALNEVCGLIAKVKMMEPPNENAWLFEAMQQSPDEIGVSIDAIAYTEEGERHGISGRIVTQWVRLNSADFVTEASAKGKFIDFSEAISMPTSADEIDHILHSLGYLDVSSLDELVESEIKEDKLIVGGISMPMELKDIQEVKIDQLLAAGNASVIEALKTKGESVKEEMQKQINTLTEQVKTSSDEVTKLTEKVSVLEKENKEFKEAADKAKAEKDKADKLVFIEETRKKYKIPEKSMKTSFKNMLEKSTNEEIETLMKEMSDTFKEETETISGDNPPRNGDNQIIKESDKNKPTEKPQITDDALINAIKGKK